ncbi:unnamed protein product [Rotaria magnacalcarata]|uniref:Nucleoside diphosphate-linked moiety X motif 6 n=2 Tax=Rotaria magnacalcarata TaxID=392030 RepID=A0A815LGW8_9BILA|nr:unnamed protein product [Rotaria magnacalcarata]CAF1404082.1 unnamed protein product [Rotaria magnacalcarata]CAF2062183.1 unnamed protein product [Rotaria magnacalcarata]CAF2146925.1 unnamed protein product [Rotaria magnacalcarata]CAF3740074.1 unnamed protein product [Rotaria magnacalcarata]
MSLFAFRPLLNIIPCRLFSQTCILPYDIDRFKGARVRIQDWPDDAKIIRNSLSISLEQWRKDKLSSVWLWIPIEKAHVIPIAAELGFSYHNAEERTAVLNQWLLPIKSMIPRFATHQVGVGGAVLHSKTNELLVIKERIRNLEIWKLPGGSAELSENIADGAVREVFEETGIRSKFESIIGFRQAHRYPGGHGRSDIYFICRLSSLTDAINFDANEVLDCKWIKLDDAFKVENPILHRTAEQLLFGLKHGFEQSIDFRLEKIPSIVTGINFNFFTRSIKSNK